MSGGTAWVVGTRPRIPAPDVPRRPVTYLVAYNVASAYPESRGMIGSEGYPYALIKRGKNEEARGNVFS